MTLLADPPAPSGEPVGPGPQERAWNAASAEAVAVMGTVNAAVARLVAALAGLLAADGWVGQGIQSPEHWVTWKAGMSRSRAEGLVRVARRIGDLPACWALFESGRLGEDAMVRIARHVPASRDAEVAALAPSLLISQLERLLRSLPEHPDTAPKPEPERTCRLSERRDGWLRGSFCLPPDEGAVVRLGMLAGRDAEFADRNGIDPHNHDPDGDMSGARHLSWADGLVRMASEAADALDPTIRRTGQRGERNQVVIHFDMDTDGTLGPGQLDMGPVVPDAVARSLACDATIQVVTTRRGQIVGITPTVRTPNRALRRALARRDQGCTHPHCTQKLWLHAHHIVYWEHGGLTTPANLTLLCPRHHRALHHGEFSIDGNPETGTLRFHDRFRRPIEPPPHHPDTVRPASPPPDGPHGNGNGATADSGEPFDPDGSPERGEPPGIGGTPASGKPPDPGHTPPGGDQTPGGTGDRATEGRPARSLFTPPLAERLTSDTFTWN
jgi:Domain of unknown function (DUF222)/HNH endonuclease